MNLQDSYIEEVRLLLRSELLFRYALVELGIQKLPKDYMTLQSAKNRADFDYNCNLMMLKQNETTLFLEKEEAFLKMYKTYFYATKALQKAIKIPKVKEYVFQMIANQWGTLTVKRKTYTQKLPEPVLKRNI